MPMYFNMNIYKNKKVLLRERKRHTAAVWLVHAMLFRFGVQHIQVLGQNGGRVPPFPIQ